MDWKIAALGIGVILAGVFAVRALSTPPALTTGPGAPVNTPGDAASQERQTVFRGVTEVLTAGAGLAGTIIQSNAQRDANATGAKRMALGAK